MRILFAKFEEEQQAPTTRAQSFIYAHIHSVTSYTVPSQYNNLFINHEVCKQIITVMAIQNWQKLTLKLIKRKGETDS